MSASDSSSPPTATAVVGSTGTTTTTAAVPVVEEASSSSKKVQDYPNYSLEDASSWPSFIFMGYLDSLFAKGNRQVLELQDLGTIAKQDRSDSLYEKFVQHYSVECKKPLNKRSLWHVLWKTVGYGKLTLALLLFAVYAALLFGPVQILTRLVRYFQGVDDFTKAELWVMVALLFVFPMIGSMCLAHSNAIMAHLGAQIRNTLISVIYRKSLKISPYRRQSISTGRIITMFSDDTNQVRTFLFFLNNSVCAPLQIGACLYLIYQQVGVATFVGLGYAICTTPLSGVVFGWLFKIRRLKMVQTDARVKLMNEILGGIRIIKYYAWENAFVKKILSIRDVEIAFLSRSGYVFNAVFSLLLLGAPQIQTVLIFLTYISLGNQLDAAKAFTTLTLFGLMNSPFIFLPFGLQQFNMSSIAMKRILEFLDAEELDVYIQKTDHGIFHEELKHGIVKPVLEFKQANLSWTPQTVIDEMQKEAENKKIAAEQEGNDIKNETGKKYSALPTSDEKDKAAAEVQDVEAGEGAVVAVSPASNPLSNRAIYTLVDLNLKIMPGQLVAIVGAVGSGKSSILSAILGEMHLRSGSISMVDKMKVAYCDQRPWIVNATVKDNILFGEEYNEQRFHQSIYACSMEDDIKILAGGVMTEIGERGINLSGGQKARVALARAVYNDADIYLLDDPLSAVDAHVGEHIFSQCIKGTLAGKTRLLVTHHLHVLPQCDMILILDGDGKVRASGSFDEIMNSGIDVEKYLGVEKKDEDEEGGNKSKDKKKNNGKGGEADKVEGDSQEVEVARSPKEEKKKDLMTKEEKNQGDVAWETYWTFIKYGGAFFFFLTMFFQASSQVLSIEANFWLADWGKETSIDNYYNGKDMTHKRAFHWFNGYAGMQMASIFFLFASRMVLNKHRTESSKRLHADVLKSVLFLPVSFFDVTPIGRIINRFSQDISTIDEDLSQSLSQVIGMGGGVIGSLGAIAGSTKGAFLILIIPLGYLYYKFQSYFRKSNTAIARVESVSRSPIYADFSQTLSGTSTIRAYSQEPRFILTLEDYANKNTVPGVFQQLAGQWLAIRLDFLGALVMFFMGALTVSLENDSFIPAGYLALGLSYAIQLTSLLKMAVRISATLEAQFNSVERVRHYIDLKNVPGNNEDESETDLVSAKGTKQVEVGDIEMNVVKADKKTLIKPPAEWPQHGNVKFDNVEMRYRDGPLVLKGVSFDVDAKDKIGIAGRTGCGKSSLMVALFRIENLAGGRVWIDGIDTSTVALRTLRSKLCIIPQDPVMFSASVRFNLDPFDEFSDEEVWEVLRSVNMADHIESMPEKLQEMVAEAGENFSAGQRQLICIARAILRKPKILVMDEATASIDSETDSLVQSMIRTKFADCTVLTIAHRLHTIIDSTKILVMDKGYVGEYDSPESLLKKEDGLFKGLWDRHVSEGGATSH